MPFLALLESLVTFKNPSPGLWFQDLAVKIQMHFCSSASEGSDCQSHLEDRDSHLFSPSYSFVSCAIWELGGINIAFVSLDKNKMLHMLLCISGILWSSVWGHRLLGWKTEWEYLEYVKFVIWDRIIHVCEEMEELYILTSAHFKFMSQSTQKIESKATERKAYLCTLFSVIQWFIKMSRSERWPLSALFPGSSGNILVDFSGFQWDRDTNVSCSVGIVRST